MLGRFSSFDLLFCFSHIESVIIEEIHLFDVPTAVANLQLAQQTTGDTKLIVITDDAVTAVPLHRCHLVTNCR